MLIMTVIVALVFIFMGFLLGRVDLSWVFFEQHGKEL
jgi:hypothetical protein